MALQTAGHFRDLPPGLHDEFSYLFQAHTFLTGQTSVPRPPLPALFDQMHVLNDGRMASRYFPATGAWMVPFVALGNPWLGWWIAQGILASLTFWIGRDAGGSLCGRWAGLLCALCPGLLLFSQLLLAHHPTLLGLAVMQLALPRMVRGHGRAWGLLAGCGLGFAALARPMTAVGIGLPWGLWLLWRGWGNQKEMRLWPWLAAPLVAAGAGQLWYDWTITGDPWKTPYGEYTARHTPKHVYGFNNVLRGERSPSSRRIEKYDDWAENLTPQLAAKNVAFRLFSSVQWTWGLLPVVLGWGLFLVNWNRVTTTARLSLASIATLHLVHIPYWYDGILHFHYVLESLPQWLLVMATAGCASREVFLREGRRLVPWWGALACIVAAGLNFTITQGLWSAPFQDGLSQFQFAREKQAKFRQLVNTTVTERPALVLIQADPSDLHIDHVVNIPPLDGPLLFAHDRPEAASIAEIRAVWPARTLYRYSAQTQRLTRVTD
jgi:4-amino-4-deoxy-L-arabinose transferase-like glycosyltransferase